MTKYNLIAVSVAWYDHKYLMHMPLVLKVPYDVSDEEEEDYVKLGVSIGLKQAGHPITTWDDISICSADLTDDIRKHFGPARCPEPSLN